MPNFDVSHVADAERLLARGGQHQVFQLSRGIAVGIHQNLKGEGCFFDPADRLEDVHFGDLIGEVGRGKTGGDQVLRTRLDDDFADVAARHVGVKHTRRVFNARLELIKGVIIKLHRAFAAGEHDRHDRKDRRRHAVHGQFAVLAQLTADGADAIPGQLLGPEHIRAGNEVD